jgi:predicted membrane metal-binding protein
MEHGFHENFERADEVSSSSDRTFGLVFVVVFLLIALWPLLDGGSPRIWSLVVAGAILLLALVAPAFLAPLNRLWTKFGLLLHRVVNPVVLGLMFYIAVVPVALIMRLVGKDPLNRRFDPQADSYWQPHDPPGPAPKSMVDQF